MPESVATRPFPSENHVERCESDAYIWAEDLPDGFVLHQNYPNPFNPSTLIQYTVPQQAQVMLDVINALGRQVKILGTSLS